MIVVEGKIRDRIAIIFGRFQPLTKAHYDMIKKAVDMYQNVFVFPVQGPGAFSLTAKTEKGKESERAKKMGRSPLPVGIRIELILKAFPELSSKNVLRLGSGSIEYVYDQLEKMYPSLKLSKLDVFAGEDEFDSYVGQIKYMKEKDKYKDVDVQIKKYDSGTRDVVSATMLRAAITNEDPDKGFEEYKKLVAPPLSDRATYNRLRKVIGRVQRLDLKESMQVLLKIIDRETNMKLKNALQEADSSVVSALKSQGKAKNRPDDDFCPIELEIGTEVEFEHVKDREAAKEIAKDHLAENPHYYTKVLGPAEKEVMDKAMKIIKKHGYKSLEEYFADAKKKMAEE